MSNKCYIFDLDGVLVDSKKIHYLALNEALTEIDKRYYISEEEQKTIFEGLSTNQKLNILTKNKGLPEYLYDDIWKNKQEKTIKFFEQLEKDYDLIEIFQEIKKNNISIAVASNSINKTLTAALKSLGIFDLIDFYASNEHVANAKPDPEIYNLCMQKLGATPSSTTIFEDSYVGKTSAFLSKARVISIKNRKDLNIEKIKFEILNQKKPLNILIPMAGEGSRFKLAGYEKPKPLINIGNTTMIDLVIKNINYNANYIFIIKKEDELQYEISNYIKSFCPKSTFIFQDKKLEGAAKSVLLAKNIINNDNPLIIANSDQYIIWNSNKTINNFINSGVDGGILTFKSNEKKWSFVKKNKNNFVSAVAEKNIISDEATCGIYYWKNGSDFVKYAEQMIQKNIKTNGEFYVCPVYNEAIQDEKIIISEMVYEMWGLGTPEDLNFYIKENEFFID